MNEAHRCVKATWTACASIGLEPVELLASAGVALSSVAKMLTEKNAAPEPEVLASASDLKRQLAGRG